MKTEIDSATTFLVELMKKSSSSKCSKTQLNEEQLHRYRGLAVECLTRHYHNHWFPEHPVKGSGYRCIRINGKVDPILAQAGHLMGLAAKFLHNLFPADFTMWVDPYEVSYRIGENGSICVLYETPSLRHPPSPPSTPPNKKIRSSPEPPATPIKTVPSYHQQVTPPPAATISQTPPQALAYQHFSPSNNRRSSPIQHQQRQHEFQQLQHQYQLAYLKEAANTNNCKDLMRSTHAPLTMERLQYVSS